MDANTTTICKDNVDAAKELEKKFGIAVQVWGGSDVEDREQEDEEQSDEKADENLMWGWTF